MEFKNTLGVLHAHTEEIKNIIERLEESDKISGIDLELILEKLRSVYDVVSDMRNELQTMTKPSGKDSSDNALTEEKKKIVDLRPEPEESVKEEEQVEVNESKPGEKKEIQAEKNIEKQKTIEKESVLSDKYKSKSPTLNEEFGSQTKQGNLSTQLNTDPILSVTGAIGLNEKFELINALFDGDKNKFDHTMQVLNSSTSFVEAYSYLEENFEWDMENPYVQRILELIRRKLIVRRNEQ
jgi:hypothetical protein